MTPPLLVICGRRNSGKTTWVCALVDALTSRGFRVGTIKHTHHDCRPPAKDSTRHQHAGARRVVLLSPTGSTQYDEWEVEPTVEQTAAQIFGGFDLVICEGYRQSRLPKFVVGEDPDADETFLLMRLPTAAGVVEPDDLDRAVSALVAQIIRPHPATIPMERRLNEEA